MKKFLKSAWGIVCIVAVALLVLCGAAVIANQLWYNAQPKFHGTTVELGTQEVPLDAFLEELANPAKAGFVTDLDQELLGKAGDVPVTLYHGRKQETVTLSIVDTTVPTARFLTQRTEPAGYIPKPEDFVIEYFDLSETMLAFHQEPQIPTDYRDLVLTVVVSDVHGNKLTQECTVTYAWMYESVTLELGQELTPALILLEAEKGEAFLDPEQLAQINTAGVGDYEIRCTSGGNTEVCTVHVVDTTGPTLQLKEKNIYPGGRAKLEDFVVLAEDLSGDVELKMTSDFDRYTLGSYPVQIEATDIHGNKTVQTTNLNVVTDTTPPYIEGLSTIYAEKNILPDYMTGVSAYDGKDGACEVTVNTDGVDLTKAGTYYAVYSATDKSGNSASEKRKVVVNHDAADTAALVASIAQSIGSDPEALRDYCREEITYTSSWGGDDPVWYGFTQYVGNCYVHNLCLNALLQYYGYETQLIWVTDQSHYWLLINLGGTWYHIDATPGPVHPRFSLMTDEQRLWTLGGRDWDHSKWPACG